jgi:hypothetical protein
MSFWKLEDAIKGGFGSVTKVKGKVKAYAVDVSNKYTKRGEANQRFVLDLSDVDIITAEDETLVGKRDSYKLFVATMDRLDTSSWMVNVVPAFNALNIELPDGVVGKTITFEKKSIFSHVKDGVDYYSTPFLPVEVSGDKPKQAAPTMTQKTSALAQRRAAQKAS